MNNLISIVNQFNLVIYTDEETSEVLETKNNPRIRVIIRPFEQFHNYEYREWWVKNHEKNYPLNTMLDWEVNVLYNEKVWFVRETWEKCYFDTEFYGWCDAGYFRNRNRKTSHDTHTRHLSNWSNPRAIHSLDKTKIHYAQVERHENPPHLEHLKNLIRDKNEDGLPKTPIPVNQVSLGSGIVILHRDLVDQWHLTFTNKLKLYMKHDYLVMNDQIIQVDCVFSEPERYRLHLEDIDNWFMFQRILM